VRHTGGDDADGHRRAALGASSSISACSGATA
jgi:hypothetical protein